MTTNWDFKTSAFLDGLARSLAWNGPNPRDAFLAAAGLKDVNTAELDELFQRTAGFDMPPWLDKADLPGCAASPCCTHPLSGSRLDLHGSSNVVLHGKIVEQIKDLAENCSDAKKKFLLLWRLLPARLETACPEFPWRLWPADPRIPSHTAWEHATVLSGFAGAGPRPALLLFTIASAQDFVTCARRTQDNWMGSFLLSWLSGAAIQAIAGKCGPDAILSPSLLGQPLIDWWLGQTLGRQAPVPSTEKRQVASLPNIFTALVPEDRAEQLCREAEAAITDSWQEIAGQVWDKMNQSVQGFAVNKNLWQRQVKSFPSRLGIFWSIRAWPEDRDPLQVIEEYSPADQGRPDSLAELEALVQTVEPNRRHNSLVFSLLSASTGRALTARKGLRDFEQIPEPGFKCSLCGQRQALADTEDAGYQDLNRFWNTLARVDARQGNSQGLKLAGRIRRGDKLCAVCLTKRLALEAYFTGTGYLDDHHLFPSTASLAVTPFLVNCLEHEDVRPHLLKFATSAHDLLRTSDILYPASLPAAVRRAASKIDHATGRNKMLRLDGAWYYPESWRTDSIEREFQAGKALTAHKDGFQDCRNKLRTLLEHSDEAGILPPSRYLAVVAMDGDKMGEWITGRQGPALLELLHGQANMSRQAMQASGIDEDFRRPMGPAMQLALSSCLADFALGPARDVVEEHGGSLVFAGGDDLLALLPATPCRPGRSLFAALQAIREAFTGVPDGFPEYDHKRLRVLGGENGMSLSMGIGVVHHSWPLNKGVAWAQDLLKNEAKEHWGRNAFALGVLTRSGGERRAGGSFAAREFGGRQESLPGVMNRICGLIAEDLLSPRIGYRLGRCRWARGARATLMDPGLVPALQQELLRLCRQHVKEETRIQEITGEIRLFHDLVRDSINRAGNSASPDPWENMTNLLINAAFLGGREA